MRLRDRTSIAAVFRRASRVSQDHLALFFRPNGLAGNRVLVSARRGFGSAVARNAERRRIKECYRLVRPRLRAGYDIAFVVTPPPADSAVLRAQVHALLRKAGLLT